MAKALKHSLVEPEHILLAIAHIESLNISKILADKGIVFEKLGLFFEENTMPQIQLQEVLDLSDSTKNLLYLSVDVARDNNHSHIAPEHLLIGLMRLEHQVIKTLLAQFQVEAKEIIKACEYHLAEVPEEAVQKLPYKTNFFDFLNQGFQAFLRKKKNDE